MDHFHPPGLHCQPVIMAILAVFPTLRNHLGMSRLSLLHQLSLLRKIWIFLMHCVHSYVLETLEEAGTWGLADIPDRVNKEGKKQILGLKNIQLGMQRAFQITISGHFDTHTHTGGMGLFHHSWLIVHPRGCQGAATGRFWDTNPHLQTLTAAVRVPYYIRRYILGSIILCCCCILLLSPASSHGSPLPSGMSHCMHSWLLSLSLHSSRIIFSSLQRKWWFKKLEYIDKGWHGRFFSHSGLCEGNRINFITDNKMRFLIRRTQECISWYSMVPQLQLSTSGDEGWCLGIFQWQPLGCCCRP